ncbi:MAG: DUF2066 domain-containing protein [Thiomicrorhabdus chilensis]|uniref:DUF2066 domain-containing protein n=1 Tax=Thiomicrorhabdus chilensis TaxID=63656 RepID=UPI00299D54D2|nr:DUF2066 domain-containing protein [Thiomicrorhabdus chilensis]MDX1347003.1 DUF2066 domain-containing protein [Thiomicrorhabdus chilensis]
MRSFILIALFMAFIPLNAVKANSGSNDTPSLFNLVETFDPEIDASGKVVKSPDLNDKIRQGMRHLLVRLTGDHAILRSQEGKAFVADAKAWLTSYYFEPRKEEGVTVGQNLVLVFDRQRMLKAFQTGQILIWPLSERPKTLVYGSFVQAGSILKLNPETLSYRPDIEFRAYPGLLALPLDFPEGNQGWIYPLAGGAGSSDIQERLIESASQYLLTFQVTKSNSQQYELHWRVYSSSGTELFSGQQQGAQLPALMEAMFDRLMANYSYGYRQNASVLGVATLGINQVASAEQLIELESYLVAQKPTIHQVSLNSIKGQRAEFEVVYQGRYESLVALFSRIDNVRLLSESALTGKVELKLRGLAERPETQLIDLSKEYETNLREER